MRDGFLGAILAAVAAELEAEPELANRLRCALGLESGSRQSALITLRQAKAEFGVPVRTMRMIIARKMIPAVRVGREYLVERADLQAWLKRRREEPRKPVESKQTQVERIFERAVREGKLVPITRAK